MEKLWPVSYTHLHHKKLEELEQLEEKQSEIQIEIDILKAKLKSLVKIENSFNDLHLQVEETQNNLKNDVDKMNVRLIEESKNLTLIVEKFQTELEEKQKEISLLRKGFYTLGVAVVIIVSVSYTHLDVYKRQAFNQPYKQFY